MRWVKTNSIANLLYHFVIYYPAPSNITYIWNFGFLAGMCLVIQLITGIALAMHYVPNILLAFDSVEHIMRDVNYGWLLRYLHANGASMFFIVVYVHIFRGIYYGSYMPPRQHLWNSGVGILLMMIITAFIGYVLPWGQMSFWGATVITNLVSAIPVVGQEIVYWLWGGFSVDNATLNKFFSLHYILPFIIVSLVIIHLVFLHEYGSNNPLGITAKIDLITFTPYLTLKDSISFLIFLMGFYIFVCFMPNVLGHPDNYVPANPMVTPPHIVPEWYFLPFYAILRAIPDKLGGVVAMITAILALIFLAILGVAEIRSALFRPIYRQLFWIFLVDALLLGWLGGNPVKYPYYELSQVCTIMYFMYVFVYVPCTVRIEKYLWAYA
jgi:quinol-cytochrome oxidoreductase complex cytochrome b subunit